MPPRRKKPAPLAVQVSVVVGPPITPYGVQLEASVPSHDVLTAYSAMVTLARMMDEHVPLQPHEQPRADHVPSGGPVGGDEEFFEESGHAGTPMPGMPPKVGF